MRKIHDYRKHAEECRELARKAGPGEHRDQLMNMAQTWEALAVERERENKIHDAIVADAKQRE
jgi:hypothetical protein